MQLRNLTLQKITAIGIFLGGCALAVYAATETAAGNTRTLILIFAAIVGGIFIINLKENFWLILPVGLSLNLPTIPLGFRQILIVAERCLLLDGAHAGSSAADRRCGNNF